MLKFFDVRSRLNSFEHASSPRPQGQRQIWRHSPLGAAATGSVEAQGWLSPSFGGRCILADRHWGGTGPCVQVTPLSPSSPGFLQYVAHSSSWGAGISRWGLFVDPQNPLYIPDKIILNIQNHENHIHGEGRQCSQYLQEIRRGHRSDRRYSQVIRIKYLKDNQVRLFFKAMNPWFGKKISFNISIEFILFFYF